MADSEFYGPMGPIRTQESIQNLDILDLTQRIDAFLMELAQCQSHSRMETSPHDIKRARAMIANFDARFQLYVGQPELDLPKYHPEPLRVPVPPSLNRIENSDIQQLIRMWIALRVELVFSDSGERSSGFKAADVTRINAIVEKMNKLVDAIEQGDEIDLPDVDNQEPPAQSFEDTGN